MNHARLSKKTGRQYRLPGEAEWEYACRAGTATPFYFGETITPDLANYHGNYTWHILGTYAGGAKGRYRKETSPVGQFPPNGFGLYDMHGNVWEWCEDDWHENYEGAPKDGSAWLNKNDSQQLKCLRGGSWHDSNPDDCRSAYRFRWGFAGRHDDFIGFRVVCGMPGLSVPSNP